MSNITSEQASNIILNHQKIGPVDVVAIARDFAIKVYLAENWPPLISGKIIKSKERGGESGYAIYVNADDCHARQRFTIAHELAHFLLHRNAIGDGIVDDALYRSGLNNKEEAAANQLAADILMPWHLINQAMDEGKETIQELALRFDVSESAMSIRLGVPA